MKAVIRQDNQTSKPRVISEAETDRVSGGGATKITLVLNNGQDQFIKDNNNNLNIHNYKL